MEAEPSPPPRRRPFVVVGGVLFLALALAVQYESFSAEYLESRVWLGWAAFLLLLFIVSALRSKTFRQSRWVIAALLLTLGGCATQVGLAQFDDTLERAAKFTCAEGRRIVAEHKGLGRDWSYLGKDLYISRASPVHGSEIYMKRYQHPVEGEWFGLMTGGWDRDPMGSADCARPGRASRASG